MRDGQFDYAVNPEMVAPWAVGSIDPSYRIDLPLSERRTPTLNGFAVNVPDKAASLAIAPPPSSAPPSDLSVFASPSAAAPPAPVGGALTSAPPQPQAPLPTQPTVTAPGGPDLSVLNGDAAGVPDFGMYGRSSSAYQPAQLMPADPSKGLSTPYYAAHTSDNDPAGNVMVAPGQKIRLVDAKTGDTVFEGTGPEAAQQAVSIANAVSDDRGRKAAWQIQADVGNGWELRAEDRLDPKKTGIWGPLLDIAAPILLNALLPGLGGALAGALGTFGGTAAFHGLANLGSGLIQGESLGKAATGALTSGVLSAGVGNLVSRVPALDSAIQSVTRPIQNAVNAGVDMSGLRYVLDPINDGLVHVIDGAGTVLTSVRGTVDSARSAVRGVLGLDNAVTAPSVTAGGNVPMPAGSVSGVTISPLPDVSLGLPTLTPSPGGGYDSSPITVRPIDQPEPGMPTLTPAPDGTFDSTPIEVRPPPAPDPGITTPIPVVDPIPTLSPVDIMPPQVVDPGVPITPPPTVPPPTPNPGLPSPPTPTGGYSGYGGFGNAGTRASLSPIYTASLPTPTFGTRTPLAPQIDQRYAIEHPEARFFSRTTQASQVDPFAVMQPSQARLAGIGDLNNDGSVDDLDLAVWRRRYGGRGYAGGGAVGGEGDGKSDSIPARLSDGEYVIDAETVALLGNGSSRAGADALDNLRVRIRRHKGHDMVSGRLSRRAHAPEHYMGNR